MVRPAEGKKPREAIDLVQDDLRFRRPRSGGGVQLLAQNASQGLLVDWPSPEVLAEKGEKGVRFEWR